MTKIVVSSSWLTQVAHTLMAAQALRNTAAAVGQKIEVEKPRSEPATRFNNRISRRRTWSSSLPMCGSNEAGFSTNRSRQIELRNAAAKRFGIRKKESFRRWSAHPADSKPARSPRGRYRYLQAGASWELKAAPLGLNPLRRPNPSLHQRGA